MCQFVGNLTLHFHALGCARSDRDQYHAQFRVGVPGYPG